LCRHDGYPTGQPGKARIGAPGKSGRAIIAFYSPRPPLESLTTRIDMKKPLGFGSRGSADPSRSQLRRLGLGHPLGRDPWRTSMPASTLPRQTVVAIDPYDPALLTGGRDGHLRGALGTLGECHDLLAKLVITGLCAPVRSTLAEHRPVPPYADRLLPPRAAPQPQRTTGRRRRVRADAAAAAPRSETGSEVRPC